MQCGVQMQRAGSLPRLPQLRHHQRLQLTSAARHQLFPERRAGHNGAMASYQVNKDAVARARRMIDARQYVLDSDWGDVQPKADDENDYLEAHGWDDYAEWHLGLTEGRPTRPRRGTPSCTATSGGCTGRR